MKPNIDPTTPANATCFWAFNPLHGCYDRADDPAKFAGVHTGRTVDGERTFGYESYVEASPLLCDAEIDDLPHIPIMQVVDAAQIRADHDDLRRKYGVQPR